jgi:hypothetical protein
MDAIELTDVEQAMVRTLDGQILETRACMGQRLRDLDEFKRVFLSSVLARHERTEGEYGLSSDGRTLVRKATKED